MAETELNSVTDNPIVILMKKPFSGGNFHGQLMALPIDYATLAAAELGNISDRKVIFYSKENIGLPKLLIESSGLNSGFMIRIYYCCVCTKIKRFVSQPRQILFLQV
jgi:histidine ammonia-lyase